jgi:hypothetical protein
VDPIAFIVVGAVLILFLAGGYAALTRRGSGIDEHRSGASRTGAARPTPGPASAASAKVLHLATDSADA